MLSTTEAQFNTPSTSSIPVTSMSGSRRRSSSSSAGSVSSPCAVCSDPAEGMHFGAHACAACGAFFRRSIAEQKVYTCAVKNCPVQGGINKASKRSTICRYCRFEKCLNAGMSPQEVQVKRLRQLEETSPVDSHSFFSTPLSSSTPTLEHIVQIRRDLADQRQLFQLQNENQCEGAEALLECLRVEWETFRELVLNQGIFRQFVDPRRYFHIKMELDSSPEFAEDITLSRGIFLASEVMDWALLTAKQGGVQKDSCFFPDGSSTEISAAGLTSFFAKDSEIKDPQCMARLCQPMFAQLVRTCARSLQAAHIDELETAFLYGTLLIQISGILSTPTQHPLQNALFEELRSHYESSGSELSVKMGNIILLNSPLIQTALEFREFISVLEIEKRIDLGLSF
ncbi:unnamed protein product, partial [Mesorhabditis belari]|uniref:NR LBD domain-containing protein n=1 Tax=Mesorhabditis belari TaxID=2138241 RepID=A0AAF3ETR5_9BILA